MIVAATRTPAEILHLDQLGTVAAGKSADFMVLDANPLENITNTRRIAKVYLRRKEVDRAGLRAGWNNRATMDGGVAFVGLRSEAHTQPALVCQPKLTLKCR